MACHFPRLSTPSIAEAIRGDPADANFVGFLNVLEGCRNAGCGHLINASSSSVYGGNTKTPFSTSDKTPSPFWA